MDSFFVASWNEKATDVNINPINKGWCDGEIIALMHSELSEALEALRHGNPPDNRIPAFGGVEAEMADLIIRIMDYGKARGFRIAEAVEAKMEYNATRPVKHGGKKF